MFPNQFLLGQKTEMVELIPKISDMIDFVVSSDEKIQFDN
jgi:hypothetical protein